MEASAKSYLTKPEQTAKVEIMFSFDNRLLCLLGGVALRRRYGVDFTARVHYAWVQPWLRAANLGNASP